jgi:hypothetical protein
MSDRVLALHRIDLHPAVQLCAQLADQGRPGALVTVLEPVLLTHAHSLGMTQVQLLPTPDCDIAHGAAARALAATRLVCAEIDELLAGLVPESRGAAWCALWWQHLHFAVYGYRQIANAMAPRLVGDKVHILLPESPHRYGHHSFVPGLVLSDRLRRAGISIQLYGSELPPADAPLLPDPLSGDAGRSGPAADLLCHLPTCFSDAPLFASEILASGRVALNLPAPQFDAPLPGVPSCTMVPPEVLANRLTASQRAHIDSTMDQLGNLLQQHLLPLLPGGRMVAAQVNTLVAGYRRNALLFHALEQRFAGQPPKTLLLSNHDADLHGALYSFARRHDVRILLVPHAKIFNEPIGSHGHDVLCLTHPLQGGYAQDLDGARMPMATLDFAETWRLRDTPHQPLAAVGMVLNGLASNAMCTIDVTVYLSGLQRLRAWCVANGIDCRIRCRPNGSAISVVCAALGIELDELIHHQDGSIADFARGCDLVLGYDVPTSGVLEVLRQGVPVLQALCRRLCPQEWRIVSPDVVPQLPLTEVLARLERFKADPHLLGELARVQTSQYLQRAAAARPLRAWL